MQYIMHGYNKPDNLVWYYSHLWREDVRRVIWSFVLKKKKHGWEHWLWITLWTNALTLAFHQKSLKFSKKEEEDFSLLRSCIQISEIWREPPPPTNFLSLFDDFSRMKEGKNDWFSIYSTSTGLFIIFRINKCDIISESVPTRKITSFSHLRRNIGYYV